MTQAQLEHTAKLFDRMKHLAKQMRHHQILYEKFKVTSDYNKARYYQKQLDDMLKAEIKKDKQQQREIF